MSDLDDYEDDFDEKLRGEFRATDDEEHTGFGPEASPSPRLGASSPQSSDGEGQSMMRMRLSKADALREARLSVMGSKLSRALDLTIRPTTSGGRGDMARSVALGSTAAGSGAAASSSSSSAAAAGAPSSSSLFSPSSLAPPSSSIGVSLRPLSSGSMRQSQDMFAALDLANTDANLKQTYVKYWDAVEEQLQAEQRAEEELRIKRTQQAEKKHLARLKTKMAQQRETAGAGAASGDRQQRQEAGWDSGFVFDKQLSPNRPAHKDPNAPPPTFPAPSVVKAQAALAAAMGGATASALSGGSSSHHGATSALGKGSSSGLSGVSNAKAMPPAPSGIVDPARVRSVVQTHMPSYVLAKLARQRGVAAKAGLSATGAVRGASAARSRKGSAATRPVVLRRVSNVSTGGGGDDDAAMFSEEISPPNLKSATSNASTMRPKSRVASAKSVRRSGGPSAAAATVTTPAARAASAGIAVKPTNASMLAAAERAAQLHAAANPPDMKQIPLAQYNRMRREIEDLRRKCVALEAENEQLRSGAPLSAADSPPVKSPPNPSPISSTHSRVTSAVPSRAASAAATRPNLSAMVASRPSAVAAPGPTPLAAVFQKAKHPGLKLNLASLRPDENGNPVIVAPPATGAASATSAANTLLSPRSRCAVSSCGQTRTPGKPYCAKHLAEQPQASPSAAAMFSPKAVRSFESTAPAISEPISISPPASATAASAAAATSVAPVAPIGGQGVGMHGLHFALGSGPPAKYSYDYESDDNYGGTDSEGEGTGSFDAEASMSMSQAKGASGASSNKMRSSVQQASVADESDFGAHGGDTQRQMNTARGNNGGSGTARAGMPTRTADATPRQHPALLASHSQSSNSSVAPVVTRMKSDPSAIADHNALYSARPSQQPPRPSASATPRMASTKLLGVHPGASPLGGAGFDLEQLRASPYANMDALGGSFEITQSGTFKRGGFSLNKHGMTTPASFGATSEAGESGGSTQRTESGTRAFPWDAAGGAVPGSYRSASSSTLVTPTSAGMGSPQSGHIRSAGSSSASTPSSASASGSSPASSTPFFRPLNVSDLYTLGVLGRGSSGVVYRAFYAPTVELLAVKCISIVEKDKRKQLTQELRTLTLAPNPHTIGFRGAYFDDAHIYLALEFMDGGSLDDLVASSGALSEIELAYLFEQVFLGLVHLEKSGIIHRDIKPHNILFDQRGRAKITDFGIISDLKQRSELADIQQAKTFVGTLLYMSPERISGREYGFPADIWSTGLSMLTCRVGEFAIRHDSHWELVNTIQQGEKMLERFEEDVLSEQLRDLLSHWSDKQHTHTNRSERLESELTVS